MISRERIQIGGILGNKVYFPSVYALTKKPGEDLVNAAATKSIENVIIREHIQISNH